MPSSPKRSLGVHRASQQKVARAFTCERPFIGITPERKVPTHSLVADEEGPLATLFGEPLPRAAVTRRTQRIALLAVGVPNVPELFVDEALWTAADILTAH